MSNKLNVLDCFKLYSKYNLSYDDQSVLTLLYQPLIGIDSFSLYLTMYSLVNRQSLSSELYTHKKILDLLNLDIKKFEKARNKLEAIGLLNVYVNENSEYIHALKAPLSAKQFLFDGALGVYLYTEIGEASFKEMLKLFKVSDLELSNYQNITKTFDDVYKSVNLDASISVFDSYVDKKKNIPIKIKNRNFDFDTFVSGLSQNFIDDANISERFIDYVKKLAYTYNLDEIEMQKVYLDSIDESNEVDYVKLSKKAREWYQYVNQSSTPKLTTKGKKKVNYTNRKDSVVSFFERITPGELLEQLSGISPAVADLKIFEQLLQNTAFDEGVINVLVAFVLGINDNKMPQYNYFEKVASEWARVGIKNVQDAYEYVKNNKKEEKKNNNKYSKKSAKKEIKPDWFDEYMKEIDN